MILKWLPLMEISIYALVTVTGHLQNIKFFKKTNSFIVSYQRDLCLFNVLLFIHKVWCYVTVQWWAIQGSFYN